MVIRMTTLRMRGGVRKQASRRIQVGFVCVSLLLAAGKLSGQETPSASGDKAPGSAQPSQPDYRFDVASIRPGPDHLTAPPGPAYTPGHYREEMISFVGLAYKAFGKKQRFEVEYQGWMATTYFAISATLPEGAAKADLPIMIRHLLDDRFDLVFHHEARQVAGYELVAAKSGFRLIKSSGPAPDAPAVKGPGFEVKNGTPQFAKDAGSMTVCTGSGCWLHGHNKTMQSLASDLADRLGAPVADATGQEGEFDYDLSFTPEPYAGPASNILSPLPMGPAAGAVGSDNAPPEHPQLRDALREELGLELRAVKNVPVDVVVLDSAKRDPTEN